MVDVGDNQPTLQVILERIDSAKNVARYYVLSVEPTLFAKDTLVRRWGCLGYTGRKNMEFFDSENEAVLALDAWLARSASADISADSEAHGVEPIARCCRSTLDLPLPYRQARRSLPAIGSGKTECSLEGRGPRVFEGRTSVSTAFARSSCNCSARASMSPAARLPAR